MPEPAKARGSSGNQILETVGKSPREASQKKSNDPSSFTREQSPADIVHVHSVSQSVPESFKVPVEINGTPVMMELDTGAAVSLVYSVLRKEFQPW